MSWSIHFNKRPKTLNFDYGTWDNVYFSETNQMSMNVSSSSANRESLPPIQQISETQQQHRRRIPPWTFVDRSFLEQFCRACRRPLPVATAVSVTIWGPCPIRCRIRLPKVSSSISMTQAAIISSLIGTRPPRRLIGFTRIPGMIVIVVAASTSFASFIWSICFNFYISPNTFASTLARTASGPSLHPQACFCITTYYILYCYGILV